jgi:hypothetical protein
MPDRNGYIGRAPSDSSVTIARQINQPTSTTSTFVFNSGYDVGYLDVYVNGTKLINVIEYAATDTQNITLTTAVGNGDKVEFVAYKAFNLANIVSSTLTNLTVNGDITSQNINSSGIVTATSFAGALIGNVTGTLTGNATGLTGIPNISCATGAFSGAVTLEDNLDMQDNDKILLGSGDDIEIFHNGTDGRITNSDGSFFIGADRCKLTNAAVTEVFVDCIANGRVDLFYDANVKLTTKSDGVDITGELQCDTLDVDGNGDISGFLTIHGGAQVNNDFTFDGATAGRDIRFDRSEDALEFEDSAKAMFGTGQDLQIFHNGTDSKITNTQGNLIIDHSNGIIRLDPKTNENGILIRPDGAVELYYDNSKKLETSATGVTVTGTLNATTDVQINGKGAATTGKAIAMAMVFG